MKWLRWWIHDAPLWYSAPVVLGLLAYAVFLFLLWRIVR